VFLPTKEQPLQLTPLAGGVVIINLLTGDQSHGHTETVCASTDSQKFLDLSQGLSCLTLQCCLQEMKWKICVGFFFWSVPLPFSWGKASVLPKTHPPPAQQDDSLLSVALLSLGSNSRTSCPSSLSLSSHLVGKQGMLTLWLRQVDTPNITLFIKSHQGSPELWLQYRKVSVQELLAKQPNLD
jgi:hypothetical protein